MVERYPGNWDNIRARFLRDLQERDHNTLTGRDAPNSHPVSAITGGLSTTNAGASVVSETSFGQSPDIGTSDNYARQDHTHGTPSAPAPGALPLVPEIIQPLDIGTNWLDLGLITGGSGISDWGTINLGNGIAVFGTTNGHIWKSTNYGKTWGDRGLIFGANFTACTYLGNGIALFGNDQGHIFRSIDYGQSWSDQGDITGGQEVRGLAYLGNGIVVFGDNAGHIWRNTNFGIAPWTDEGAIGGVNFFVLSAYLENGIIIFSSNFPGQILRSTDKGLSWSLSEVISTTVIAAIKYIGSGIVVMGDDNHHIFRSTNYGLTWTDEGVVSTNAIFILEYVGNGIVVMGDDSGHVFKSMDFGQTWTDLGKITSGNGAWDSGAYLGNGIIIFNDNNGHVYWSDTSFKMF